MIRSLLILFICLIPFQNAHAESEKVKKLQKRLTDVSDTAKVNQMLDLAAEYEYTDRNQAKEYAEEARTFSEALNYKEGQIRSYYELAIISFLNGERRKALPNIEKGMEISHEIGNDLFIARGNFHLSHYYEEKGEYLKALELLNKSLTIYISHNDLKRISQCYSSFGGIYKALGQYEEALTYYFKALPIKEEIGDLRGKSIILSNIGGVYLLTSKLEESLNYFYQCLEIDRANNDYEGIVYTLSRIGVANQKMDLADNALAYYDSALVMAREHDFRIDESLLLGNIGSTLGSQGKLQESLDYLFAALELKRGLNRFGSAAHTCNDICETYLDMGNPTQAKKYALLAIDYAANVNVDQQRVGLYLLAECEYALKDYKNAYDHLAQANMITDSIFTSESEAHINELEIKYQTAQKEQEIASLTKANEAVKLGRDTYIAGGIIVSLLLLILYYHQRMRSRRNRKQLEKEKEIDRMKSRFFANISHEFRTPLTLLLGPIDELIASTEKGEVKRKLKVMERNASRLLNLVNQLLDLSKIESGKLKLNVSNSDIIGVIRGVSTSFHSIAERKNMELVLDVEPNHLEMNYDKEKFETILTNILSNAFKFTPAGKKIVIRTRVTSLTNKNRLREHLIVTVTDTGQGISEEDISQIFNRFYRSDTNQLLQQEGSGIGLALSKELVELHEGKISAQSTSGKGTTFIVELPTDLPLRDNMVMKGDTVTLQVPQTSQMEFDENNEIVEQPLNDLPMVLVIEDHADVRDYIKDILIKAYSVIIAKDGEEGIQKALGITPDLIISDVMMPKMDGYEVCHQLKTNELTSHIPVIMLTAKADLEDKLEGLRAKADDYISKPFAPKELLVRVRNLIELRKQLREKYKTEGVLRPSDITTNSIDEQFLNRIVEMVEANMGIETFGVEQLAKELGMSRSQLHRKLKALINQGPNQFIRSFRLQRAHQLLEQNYATASEIAFKVGFGSPSYFSKCFREQFGYTPSEIPA